MKPAIGALLLLALFAGVIADPNFVDGALCELTGSPTLACP